MLCLPHAWHGLSGNVPSSVGKAGDAVTAHPIPRVLSVTLPRTERNAVTPPFGLRLLGRGGRSFNHRKTVIYMNLADRTINPLTTFRASFTQSEGAMLPYTIDYGVMLNGDPISNSTWSGNGLTISSSFNENTVVAVLSGPAGNYTVKNTIETQGGIVDSREIALTITAKERAGDYS